MAKLNTVAVAFRTEQLEPVAKVMKKEWHSQDVFRRCVVLWFIGKCNVKDKNAQMKLIQEFEAMPGGFGTNCSQFNQSAGRESQAKQLDSGSLAEFLVDIEK
jgi:hypothetical protein